MQAVMNRGGRLSRAVAAGVGAFTLWSGCASAQPDEGVMLDVRFAGLANIQPHAKDEAAYKALMMLGERLAEIPGETGGPEEARAGIELLWDFFRGGHGLRIDRTAEGPGVAVALTVSPEAPTTVQSYLDTFAEFAEASGGPIEADGHGYVLSTPLGDATLRAGGDADHPSVVVLVGATRPASLGPAVYDLPQGTRPVFSAEVNLPALGRLLAQAIADNDPGFAEFIDQNRWAIDQAPMVRLAVGSDSTRTNLTARMVDARQWLTRLGMNPAIAFTVDDIDDIPRDATLMTVFAFNFGVVTSVLDWVAEQEGKDPFGDFEEEFGFDLRGDVIENLGPRFAYYHALSTGGGGLLSAVLVAEIQDAQRLEATHADLIQRFNELSARETRGYVRIRPWKAGETEVFSVATPGLPLPFEPSWAIVNGKFVAAMTPGGLVAAIEQMTAGGPSIADNDLFRRAIAASLPESGAAQISFSDTAHFARVGYSVTSLLTSSLSNTVRSPLGSDREPGILIPSYGAFLDDIRPLARVQYFEGDDYVVKIIADGSTLVQIAEAVGQFGGGQGALATTTMQLASLMPMIGKARASATQLRGATQVRALVQAMHMYAAEDMVAPESAAVLVELGFIDHETLVSPGGSAWDGKGDIVLRTTLDADTMISFRAEVVVAMDRAMYVNGNEIVNVGFSDGHVDALSRWEVDEYLDMEINAGAREDFMLDE